MKTSLKTLRKHAKNQQQIDEGKNNGEPIFYWFGNQFSNIRFSHEIINIGHTGWFTNVHGETYKDRAGLCKGFVLTLPAMPGFTDGRHMAGYYWGDNDEYVLWPKLYADIEEAARDADRYAEQFAETAREDDEKWNKARQLEDENEYAMRRLRECLALRHKKNMPYIREEISEICETIRKNRELLRTEFADYL